MLHVALLHAMVALKTPAALWVDLAGAAKARTRDWFIDRAERAGVPWRALVAAYAADESALAKIYDEVRDNDVRYPTYYTKPFHGYDAGNLNWKAAHEMRASTMSISCGYWDDDAPAEVSAARMRGAFVNTTERYRRQTVGATGAPTTVVDLGCSTGISTDLLARQYPDCKAIGIDLSPYFLAVARRDAAVGRHAPNVEFVHADAERVPLADASCDLVSSAFVFHEMPTHAVRGALAESRRLLRRGGVVSILDLDPDALAARFATQPWRRWAFDLTEPHIREHYGRDVARLLEEAGFDAVRRVRNDPLNSVWLGLVAP